MLSFVIKKVVTHLLMPLFVAMLLGLLALLCVGRRQKLTKCLLLGMLCFLLLFSNEPFSNLLVSSLEREYPPLQISSLSQVATESPRWIVVLGGGVLPDPSLPLSSQLSSHSLYRVTEGIRLARELPQAQLILSGGNINGLPGDGTIMRKFAVAAGIAPERCIEESASLDTIEQARAVKSLVSSQAIVLVTSALHMPRALGMFRKEGLTVIPAPTAFQTGNVPSPWWSDIIPHEAALYSSRLALHEHVGLFWARLRGQL